MGVLEDTQYFDEGALTDVSSLDVGEIYSGDEVNEYYAEGEKNE